MGICLEFDAILISEATIELFCLKPDILINDLPKK